MKRKQNDFKVEIDDSLVKSKTREIGSLIENLTLPYVLCILGTVIVEVVLSAINQGYNIETVVSLWLNGLSKRVKDIHTGIQNQSDMPSSMYN